VTRYSEIAKALNIDPAQGVEELLAQTGELIIGGRLVTAEKPKAMGKAAAAEETETEPEGEANHG
jgi:hypothetical protein